MSETREQNHCLLDESSNAFGLRLEIDGDQLHCLASITTQTPGDTLSSTTLLAMLKQLGITGDIDQAAVEAFCQQARDGQAPQEIPLVKGVPPGPGVDGYLEVFDLKSRPSAVPDHNVEGSVDHHQVQVFDNVEPGMVIACIRPPQVGPTGTTVTGRVIPGIVGQEAAIKLGPGIRLDDETGTITATLSGRIVHDGQTISVSETYDVNGNVDYSVGSIHFNGEVRITGDVLDGFRVYATKKLTIGGTVGACHITGGEDIVLGSINGQGQGFIRSGGTLTARYLNEATVEADGDVIVQNEIRNCSIKSRGIISVPNGVIVGGEAVALQGIDANRLGGPANLTTTLIAGVDFAALNRQRFLQNRLAEVTHEISHILNLVGKIREIHHVEEDDSDDTLPNMQRLLDRYEGLGNTQVVIEAELEQYRGHVAEATNPKINVRQIAHEGVVIVMAGIHQRLYGDLAEARSIVPDPTEPDRLYFAPLTPLTLPAADSVPDTTQKDNGSEG